MPQSHHQLQHAHNVGLTTQALSLSVRPTADDDFVECRKAHLMTVPMLPSRRRVCPAADDDFVIKCQ